MPITNIGLPTSFVPTSITGCQLWLDAADSSSMTFSGSNITGWNDKSGSNNHVTAGGTGYPFLGTTTTGKQCINLIGSNYFASPGATNMTGGSTTLFITAFGKTNASSLYVWCYNGNNRIVRSDLYYNGANNFSYTQNYFGGSNAIFTMIENIGGSASGYFNGTLNGSTGAASTSANAGIQIGCYYNTSFTSFFWVGNIQEIIYYNSALNTTQQQQVEKYLAWKWGLTTQMGISHPGYRPPPVPLTLTPYIPFYILSYTGDYIYFTVPTKATGLTFYMWGAGGGYVTNSAVYAGGGAFLTGSLAASPGEQLRIIVGMGGLVSFTVLNPVGTDAQGGGGGGGVYGGMGGGRSAIQKYISNTWTEVVTAGGGGGAGNNADDSGGNAYWNGSQSQGAGNTYGQYVTATGGSSTAAGLGAQITGRTQNYPANNGGAFYGGTALNNNGSAGGGGGGGYYGGGGGGFNGAAEVSGGGGGGSYYNATYISNLTGFNGSNRTAVASSYSFYDGAAGRASATNSVPGSNGLVVFAPSYTRISATKSAYSVVPYSAGANNFTTPGSNSYTVPATAGGSAVAGVYIYLLGCAGSAGHNPAGGGGFVSGFYSCKPGTKFIYVVGGTSAYNLNVAYGGGAAQGGGFSGVFLSNAGGIVQSNAIAIAGGGGGGGYFGIGNGGGGGYPNGYSGTQGNTYGTIGGGTQTAGGAGGNPGSALLGGAASTGNGAQGGGGGWFGGGSGFKWTPDGTFDDRPAGCGGSSYIGNVNGATGGIGLTSGAYYEQGFTSGVVNTYAGSSSPYYVNATTPFVVIVPATTQYPTPLSIYN